MKKLISKLTNFLPSRWFKEIEENKKLEQLNRTQTGRIDFKIVYLWSIG